MNEIRRKKRSKKRGKSKNKEFMDAALDAFIRDQSLKKWREVDGLREGAQIENAVRGAVLEEREVRKNRADALLEDSFEYKEFIARQMEHLLFEAGGDIEEDI